MACIVFLGIKINFEIAVRFFFKLIGLNQVQKGFDRELKLLFSTSVREEEFYPTIVANFRVKRETKRIFCLLFSRC